MGHCLRKTLLRAANGGWLRSGDALAHAVLQDGVAFGPKRVPIARWELHQAYENTYALLMQREGSVHYCEGFAKVPGQPMVLHSWCVDREGAVIDPTLPEELVGQAEYFGMAFSQRYLFEEINANNLLGILPVVGWAYDRNGILPLPLSLRALEPYAPTAKEFIDDQIALLKGSASSAPRRAQRGATGARMTTSG